LPALAAKESFQQALELVKQLHKASPAPINLELLKTVSLERAMQLRGQGYNRDAATMLEVASRLDEKNVAWQGKLAARWPGAAMWPEPWLLPIG